MDVLVEATGKRWDRRKPGDQRMNFEGRKERTSWRAVLLVFERAEAKGVGEGMLSHRSKSEKSASRTHQELSSVA